ncbi:hypothetical protein EV426DRAFT_703100 [Tirmania nivea]|nr:hypothetical protein EV426DRAFT_703100 [Tirmania nivea]
MSNKVLVVKDRISVERALEIISRGLVIQDVTKFSEVLESSISTAYLEEGDLAIKEVTVHTDEDIEIEDIVREGFEVNEGKLKNLSKSRHVVKRLSQEEEKKKEKGLEEKDDEDMGEKEENSEIAETFYKVPSNSREM